MNGPSTFYTYDRPDCREGNVSYVSLHETLQPLLVITLDMAAYSSDPWFVTADLIKFCSIIGFNRIHYLCLLLCAYWTFAWVGPSCYVLKLVASSLNLSVRQPYCVRC